MNYEQNKYVECSALNYNILYSSVMRLPADVITFYNIMHA